MQRIRLFQRENYYSYFLDDCAEDTSISMIILGRFFASDVGCRTTFKDWAYTATDGDCCSGNITRLEIEGDDILMTDLYPEIPTVLKMKKDQFIKLFGEWLEKVCKKKKPKEVIIFYDNDKFWIETKE